MVFRLFLIAVLSYVIASVNSSALISGYVFQGDAYRAVSYSRLYYLYKTKGVIYTLIAELFKALIVITVGGLLLRGAGFPSVGKLTAMLFALLGQFMPVFNGFRPYKNMVWGALLALVFDWRIALICILVFAVLVVLTKYVSLGALACAIVFPVAVAVFGGWWLKIVLAVLCSLVIIALYRFNLFRLIYRTDAPADSGNDTAR